MFWLTLVGLFWVEAAQSVSIERSEFRNELLSYTLIDYMVYHRTSADDYNRYAKVTGDSGWTWDSLQPYFRRVWLIHSLSSSFLTTLYPERELYRTG